jgi:hypothetical protein
MTHVALDIEQFDEVEAPVSAEAVLVCAIGIGGILLGVAVAALS